MIRQPETEIWNKLWGQKGVPAPWFEQTDFINKLIDIFKSMAPLRSPVLDVGCGRGKFLEYLFKQDGYWGWGADFSHESIKSCAVPAIVSDGYALPFASGTFYSITSILVIEHMPDYDRFLAESHRMLKPGGCLYLIFPNFFSLVTPAMKLRKLLFKEGEENFYFQTLKRQNVCTCLEKTGYQILSSAYLSIGTYLSGLEHFIGSSIGSLLPEKNREEIVLVCRKKP